MDRLVLFGLVALLFPITCLGQATTCTCGIPQTTKIVGGVAAQLHQFPWQAALVFTGNTLPFCGGTLISSRTILTAAHCYMSPSSFKVVLGAQDLSAPNSGQKSFTPISFVKHPSYDPNTFVNDVAIITLSTDVVFNSSISPMCLPVGAGAVHENKKDIISGWGTLSSNGNQPNVLQTANVTTMSNAACISSPYLYTSADIFPSMICAADSGKDTCQGDSGGPMIGLSANGLNYEQIGITSWGYGCADPRYPGVYSRVSEGKSWILSQLTGTVCPAPSASAVTMTTSRTTTTTATTTKSTTTIKSTTTTRPTATSTTTLRTSTTTLKTTTTAATTRTSTSSTSTRTTTTTRTTPTTVTTAKTSTTTVAATTTKSATGCLCGTSPAPKIVGGVAAVPAEFPWQVALVRNGNTLPFCGGSLISSRTVLTASHCYTSPSSFGVVLGAHNLLAPTTGQKRILPVSFVKHPNFDSNTMQYDYAIITLASDVVFSSSISPICLPLGSGTVHENKIDTISGWGTLFSNGNQPYVLQKANVTTMSNAACITSPNKYTSADIFPTMICAASPGKDTCQGDSGGPMVSPAASGLSYELIGITSWGYGCADPSYPGVYARVSMALAWIQSQITGTVCPAPTQTATIPTITTTAKTTLTTTTPTKITPATTTIAPTPSSVVCTCTCSSG